MSNYFTDDMSPSLQEIGRYYARMHITSIFQKAERMFAQEWAQKSIKIKINVKQQEIQLKIRNKDAESLDESEFIRAKDAIINELQSDLEANLISPENMREDCSFKLKQFCDELIAQNSNDFKCVGLDPYIDSEDRKDLKAVRFVRMLFDWQFEDDPKWQEYVKKMMIQPDDHTLKTTVERWTKFAEPGQEETRREKVTTILQNKTKVMNEKCIELFKKFKEELHDLIKADDEENDRQKLNERDLDQRALEKYHELFRSRFKKFDQDRSDKFIKKDQCHSADCWNSNSGDGFELPGLCYELNWEKDPQYSKICEYTILRRIEMQAERNKRIHEAKMQDMIYKCDSQLQELFTMSNMTLNNIEEIATTIFTIIMNRAVDQILSGVEEFFKRRIANMEEKFNKPENLERTM